SVTAQGYAPGYKRGVLVPNPDVSIALFKGTAVTGRVLAQTDGGTEPAPGATVLARSDDARIAAQTVAGQDGSYQIDALAPGRYELLAALEGATSVDLNSQRGKPIEIARGQTQPVQADLILHAGGTLKGTVTDTRATPLSDASVDLYMMRKSNQQWELWNSLTTDSSGAFAFVGLPSGRYYMRVRKANFGELRYSSEYIIGLGESLDGIMLQLQAAAAIGGTVTEQGGYPLPGVLVRVEGSDCSGVSDAEGNFSLNCVSQDFGQVNLIFSLIGYENKKVMDVSVGTNDLAVTLRRGGIVRGRVTDKESGASVAGAILRLWELDLSGNRSQVGQNPTASTGSDGVYEFRGVTLEVPFEIEVSCEGFEPQKKEDFMGTEGQLTLDFQLESGCVLTGIAMNLKDSQPIPDVEIRAAYGDKVKRVYTDSAGEFQISGLPRGQITLRVYHREFGSSFSVKSDEQVRDFQIVTLSGAETDVSIYMRRGVALRGTVTARSSGEPVGGVQISEIASGRFTQTGQDGFYLLDGLSAQQGLRLAIVADGYEEIFLDPQKLSFPIGMHDLSFQVGRGGTIRGHVTPMSGDYKIFLQRVNRGDEEEFYARAYCTQPDWEYAIP
ncbi:MAG TPA: carboxypeptidase regulatory-like domain-containing protein, partial [bacterium]|nr:carboxypeptidase regulatory-like domain-containing protein [bacterium]